MKLIFTTILAIVSLTHLAQAGLSENDPCYRVVQKAIDVGFKANGSSGFVDLQFKDDRPLFDYDQKMKEIRGEWMNSRYVSHFAFEHREEIRKKLLPSEYGRIEHLYATIPQDSFDDLFGPEYIYELDFSHFNFLGVSSKFYEFEKDNTDARFRFVQEAFALWLLQPQKEGPAKYTLEKLNALAKEYDMDNRPNVIRVRADLPIYTYSLTRSEIYTDPITNQVATVHYNSDGIIDALNLSLSDVEIKMGLTGGSAQDSWHPTDWHCVIGEDFSVTEKNSTVPLWEDRMSSGCEYAQLIAPLASKLVGKTTREALLDKSAQKSKASAYDRVYAKVVEWLGFLPTDASAETHKKILDYCERYQGVFAFDKTNLSADSLNLKHIKSELSPILKKEKILETEVFAQ